jgi:hypothetical protein
MQLTKLTDRTVISAFLGALLLAVGVSIAYADTYQTNLSGSNEVPSVSTNTSGSASVTFDDNGGNMTYSLSVYNGDEITAAHLHCGDPGENGPALVTLFSDSSGTDVNGSLATGSIGDQHIHDVDCTNTIGYDVANVDDLAEAIENGDIYVNTHSQAYPDGVARGQLPSDGNDGNGNDGNNDDDDDYGNGNGDDNGYGGHSDGHGWKDDDHDGKTDWYQDRDGNWKDSCKDWSDDDHDGKHDWNHQDKGQWDKDHGQKNDWDNHRDWNDGKGGHSDWDQKDRNDDDWKKDEWKEDDRKDWNDEKKDNWDNDWKDEDWNRDENKDDWKKDHDKDDWGNRGKDGNDGKGGHDGKDGKDGYSKNDAWDNHFLNVRSGLRLGVRL